jgi:MFS family permease
MFFLNTLYLQGILGYSPLQAGLAFVPTTVGVVIAAGLSARLVGRFGVHRLLVFGLAVAAAGLALFTRVPVDGSYWVDVLPASLVLALGLGNAFVPITIAATANVAASDSGLASGILNTSQQIGGALGLAILATVAAETTASFGEVTPEALVSGYQRAYLIGAILLAAGAALALGLLRRVAIRTGDEPVQATI